MPAETFLCRTEIPMYPVAFMRSVGGGTNCGSTAEALASSRNTRECENIVGLTLDRWE